MSPPLKYLFAALFEDGSEIKQPPDDISLLNPSKSSFFDVLEQTKTALISLFGLYNEENAYMINLSNGEFDVNGAKFFLHDTDLKISNLRIVYFRKNNKQFSSDGTEQKSKVSYILGWQGNLNDGSNVKYVIEIE